jgi:hypothetical protein
MTVIPLSRPRGIADDVASLPLSAEWADPRHFATNAAGIVHDVTGRLLNALTETMASAGARSVNDTGARRTADTLRDARIALDIALTAAGRALADREVRIRTR